MVEETTVVINPDPEHERSPTPELDPTVESGKFLMPKMLFGTFQMCQNWPKLMFSNW